MNAIKDIKTTNSKSKIVTIIYLAIFELAALLSDLT